LQKLMCAVMMHWLETPGSCTFCFFCWSTVCADYSLSRATAQK
jgi:hypothetical protein